MNNPNNIPQSAIHHPPLEVLIVEDSPTQAAQLEEVLRLRGYQTQTAVNGRQALEAVRRRQPSVIISDILMPVMDGFQLCRAIKQEPGLRHIPVILLTSLSSPADVLSALEAGADFHIPKLCESEYLAAKIMDILSPRAEGGRAESETVETVTFDGTAYQISASRGQMLRLLLSTYEVAIRKNQELLSARDELQTLNEQLETKVRARTSALDAEVAERKRAEERLAEQARILGLVPDAIVLQDFDDVISYWNQGSEKLFGWTAAEAVGRKAPDLFSKDTAHLSEAKQAVLRSGEWRGELLYVSKDGRQIIVENHWALARNPDQSRAILSISTDISERKKTESLLLRSQRLDSVGRLASGIAHDLNNILAPILMAAPMLHEVTADPDAIKMLDIIESSAQRGADIIKQLLIFGRGTDGQRVPVQLRLMVKDMAAIIAETFPKNIQAKQDVPRDPWLVTGDPTQVHQILLNLCINARDAMREGGTLTIKLENRELDDLFAGLTPGTRPGRYVCLSVADTGQGIAPEDLDKIYDPFFTTKEPGKGTGLGLSTVLGIVKSHGGFIQVQSQPGRGTQFQVFLPASQAAETKPANQASQPLPRGCGELVLVVDDESSVRQVTRRMLEHSGYRVIEAANGAEGLTQFVERQSDVQVVLTDLAMPIMDGVAFIRALRQLNPQVRVITVSGRQSNAHLPADLGLPEEFHLSKPFSASLLLETLHHVLHPREAGRTAGKLEP